MRFGGVFQKYNQPSTTASTLFTTSLQLKAAAIFGSVCGRRASYCLFSSNRLPRTAPIIYRYTLSTWLLVSL